MVVIIDRFEGDFAVCEKTDRTTINISKEKIPADAKEGYIMIIDGDKITIDYEATAKRKKTVKKLMDELWK